MVGKIARCDDAEQDTGQTFQYEDPAPSGEAVPMNGLENPARKRESNNHRERLSDHEPGLGASAIFGAEPVGQIHDDPWKETCFGCTQQKAGEVELMGNGAVAEQRHADKTGSGGHDAPGDHDARQPFARAPPFDDQSARDLKKEVAEEEDTSAEADHG